MLHLPLVALAVGALLPTARAQTDCGGFSDGFAMPGIPLTTVFALESWDDGQGEKLYAAGYTSGLGGLVLRRDGRSWTVLFETINISAHLATGTIAGVPELFVGTRTQATTRIGNWNGAGLTQAGGLGYNLVDLEILDIGNGPELISLGTLPHGGHPLQSTSRVERWNGTDWTPIGPDLPERASAICAHDDGSGPKLHVGGWFGLAGQNSVIQWDGSAWVEVGVIGNYVVDLCSFPGPGGAELIAAVDMPPGRSGQGLQRFVAGAWGPVPGPAPVTLDDGLSLCRVDFGSGPRLAVAGRQGALTYGFLYDGAQTTYLGGFPSFCGEHMAAIGSGPSAELYTWGGDVNSVIDASGETRWANSFARFSPTQGWSPEAQGFDYHVNALAAFGNRLAAGGEFARNGDALNINSHVALWNGTEWERAGSSALPFCNALHTIDLGSGPQLIAGIDAGAGAGLRQWNGTAWDVLSGTPNGACYALATYPTVSGDQLALGGSLSAGPFPSNVFKFNGSAFQNLGNVTGPVRALASYQEGPTTMLFAAGAFSAVNGVPATNIARWNGSAWSAVGTGLSGGDVNALCVFDDGNGPQLYAGGSFTTAGGLPTPSLARWDGTSWSIVPGTGTDGVVHALHVHDDGRGPALYVGGLFASAGLIQAFHVARFDGVAWEPVQAGFNDAVKCFASLDDDGDGDQELFLGGDFQQTPTKQTGHIARLEGCPHYTSFCFGDGTFTDHTSACPCLNYGAPGHGCSNSLVVEGALLEAAGNVNPDDLVLTGSGQPLSTLGMFMQHDATGDSVFHDGVLCASGTLIRLRLRGAVGGVTVFPDSTDTVTVSERGLVVPGSGVTRYYSLFYRNAATVFCPPATANVTNGIRVVW